jgi:hypothetical protein
VKQLQKFKELLLAKKISVVTGNEEFVCTNGKKKYILPLTIFNHSLIAHSPEKFAALIQSKLGLNKTVFARNCVVSKLDKTTVEEFLEEYHLMNSTQSAFNYGLYCKNELLAVASFSKGRKMNRLPEDKRSFELIRFCCKNGITITGGLTKLVKNFCKEKQAGDIMTYIDKQFSSGESFIKAGFVLHGETSPNYFLINKKSLEKIPVKNDEEKFDREKFVITKNEGNLKLVYTPVE